MKLFKYVLTTLVISLIFVYSCKKEDPIAPELLPISTFAMSYGDFDTTAALKTTGFDPNKENFAHAALNVFAWNIVIAIHGIVPVAAFQESFNHEAIYDKKSKTWSWSYDVMVIVPHQCRLEAKKVDTDIHWSMYVSQAGGFTDYLWYSGISAIDRTTGSWILYKSPNSGVVGKYLEILWHRNSDGTSDIKYTNVESGAVNQGGYIEYGVTSATDFDAYYDIITLDPTTNTTNIKWHRATIEGKVKDPKKFGDSDWHCWNEMLRDTVCYK